MLSSMSLEKYLSSPKLERPIYVSDISDPLFSGMNPFEYMTKKTIIFLRL